jgi:hypothetical protein
MGKYGNILSVGRSRLARTNLHTLNTLGKNQNSVILSEAKNLSFFVLLRLNRREILRFAQNDKIDYFFRLLKARATGTLRD